MRFLADECCDFAVVRALRNGGHDVMAICEIDSRSVDLNLMDLAHKENRILLTEDKDFGWLAYAAHVNSAGVVLIRFPSHSRKQLAEAAIQLVTEHGDRLSGAFVVLRPGSVRISTLPQR